ncbi:hypothetical protein GCM10018787_29290 [Streptomyces thermodiastaticus]|nr:hypothetical protein GCM10018787_29290 [Streptomyces thermodiastaticus]
MTVNAKKAARSVVVTAPAATTTAVVRPRWEAAAIGHPPGMATAAQRPQRTSPATESGACGPAPWPETGAGRPPGLIPSLRGRLGGARALSGF